jgi:fumarate hydratase class I
MNPYTPGVLERYGVRVIIGKGGMDDEVLAALGRRGAVYVCAVGGAGGVLAKSIVSVRGHHKLEEFGTPEAMWVLEVKDFPAVVTMDAHGRSLHAEVQRRSRSELDKLLEMG